MKRILACFMFIALVVTASGCSSNSSELTLSGDVQNNIISSNSTVQGKIVEMKKQQGEIVKKGEVIAIIDSTNQKYSVDQLQAVVNMKKAKLEELQAGTRTQQLDQSKAQVRAAKAQLDLLKAGSSAQQISQAKNNVSIATEAMEAAQISYDYLTTIYNNTLTAEAKYKLDTAGTQLSTTKYQLSNANQQLTLLQNGSSSQAVSAAQANYDAANAQLSLLQSGSTKQSIATAQADLDQAAAQLSQAQNVLSNFNITALADGIIISKNFELGDIVSPGSNIADIAVANDLYVVCYVPVKYLDKVYYNQPLTVTTSTGTQTGNVNYIALKTEYTPKDELSTTGKGNTTTKIKVSIKDEKGLLKSGMTAKVILPLK